MARIVGYIAASLDGFIATENDGLDWLYAYDGMDLGELDYHAFVKGIRTVVMGRRTYDFLEQDQSAWPYGEQRVYVLTSHPVDNPKAQVEIRSNIECLIDELRALDDGRVWMLGGGQLQMTFMERGAPDEIEIYIFPELLGGGRPLFPATGFRSSPTLIEAKALDRGCVRIHYRFD